MVSRIKFTGLQLQGGSDQISLEDLDPPGLSGQPMVAERILARVVYGVGVNMLRYWLRDHVVSKDCLTLASVFAFIKQKKAKGGWPWPFILLACCWGLSECKQ